MSILEDDPLANNILLHLYRSTIIHSINGIGMILGIKTTSGMNPRFKDLRAAFDELGEEKRHIFFRAVAAIAEFAVYQTLDFIETYNRFDSEENDEEFPRLELHYRPGPDNDVQSITLSEFDSERLGQLFKQIARLDEVKAMVECAINQKIERSAKD